MQDFIFVKKNGRFEKISFSELIFVKGMRGYMQIVTESKVYFVLNTMEEVEKCLPKDLFCRVHRSYIVCIKRIQTFDNWKLFLHVPVEGERYSGLAKETELPIGRAFRKRLKESVKIVPNRMNKYVKKILEKAEFLHEIGLDEE